MPGLNPDHQADPSSPLLVQVVEQQGAGRFAMHINIRQSETGFRLASDRYQLHPSFTQARDVWVVGDRLDDHCAVDIQRIQ
ncbi:hypothetical protein D3C85_528070 [compost metagenome]